MRLIELREALADTVGALIEAKRHRHRHGRAHATVTATLAQMLEQDVAAQGNTRKIERAFELLFGRTPTEAELNALMAEHFKDLKR